MFAELSLTSHKKQFSSAIYCIFAVVAFLWVRQMFAHTSNIIVSFSSSVSGPENVGF